MTAEDEIRALVARYGDRPKVSIESLSRWAAEIDSLRARIAELEAEVAAVSAVRIHGCDCSDDEACYFGRQMVAAEARVRELEAEVERLWGEEG